MRTHKLFIVAFALIIVPPSIGGIFSYQHTGQWTDIQKTTLYTRDIKEDKDYGKAYFSFQYGVRGDVETVKTKKDWDIKYGYASINGSSDYFGVTMISNDRSRIKDLGRQNWSEIKQVPVLPGNSGPYKGIRFPLNGESIEETSEGQVTKVVEGHMYVAHIKDEDTDLYVLLRVEVLVPNDRCTITWKVVASPEEKK